MTINGTKVTKAQAAVYEVLNSYGPIADHALVPLAQHQALLRMSSSGIRSRRSELCDLGLVKATGSVRTGSNRTATVYDVT